jgi:hypothetical protein
MLDAAAGIHVRLPGPVYWEVLNKVKLLTYATVSQMTHSES